MSNIFIFRRDLRLHDNKGFITACKYTNLICIFILCPIQLGKQNKYKSDRAVSFMMCSLHTLKNKLRDIGGDLFVYSGDDIAVIRGIIAKYTIDNIICNKDITPFAVERDHKIEKMCQKNNIGFIHVEDYTIFPLYTILKQDKSPYVIYSAFRKQFISLGNPSIHKINKKIQFHNIRDYNTIKIPNHREIVGEHIGVFIKFGCISPRVAYLTTPEIHDKLIWREFFYILAYHRPSTFLFGIKNVVIKWVDNPIFIDMWKRGITGFPIVDAGMRQLVKTGYIDNRMRLIVSSFLRLLGANWRIGERFFAINLLDYDPILNNSNWQWIYSIGTDTKPPSQRLFNPWIQSKKYDPDCEYIKKWVPEVRKYDPKEIHNFQTMSGKYSPIIDYKRYKQIDKLRYLNKI